MYDIIIVGGGPAGMTAALYALRNGRTVLVIEKTGFGGQITHSPKVENYPGTLQMRGNEFAERLLDQILAQGAAIELETVIRVEDLGDRKAVRTEEGGCYEAKAVILSVGVRHRMPGLAGEDELVGEGLSFCAVCDGDFYSDQEVCVAGGGNSALQEAILLAEKCSRVTIVQDLPVLTGEKKLQDVLLTKPNVTVLTGQKITGYVRGENGEFLGLTLQEREGGGQRDVLCSGLFIAIGLIPENEPFRELADLDESGYFASDEQCMTRTPGIFTAGDCRRKQIRQLTTACADGAVAALAACRFINEA